MKLLCLDFGGTFIKRGVIDDNKTIFDYPKVDGIDSLEAAIKVVKDFHELVDKDHQIEGIAISMYGIISPSEFSQSWSKDLWYHNISFRNEINKTLKLPVHVVNDGQASLVGAVWRGEVNKNDDTIAITIGTGIAGAFWINGKLALGVDGAAGQLGDILTYNPIEDTTENYARQHSTSKILRDFKKSEGYEIDGETLLKLIKNNEASKEFAILFNNWVSRLGVYFASLVNVFNPKTLLVSGGIFEDTSLFELVIKAYEKHKTKFDYKLTTEVKLMKTVKNGNLFGAAYNYFILENINV